jgi:hypothetical protein
MPQSITREPFVKQSVSLRRDQLAALKQVVRDDGHANLSRVIQGLVEVELRSRYGRDWSKDFTIVSIEPSELAAAS